MEVQLTDFENAAFTVFVVLVTRVVLAFDLALYIPLSKVNEASVDLTLYRSLVR
jgi:glutamate--cysteine ligase catalytic subunit